jgi:hypothetical protein
VARHFSTLTPDQMSRNREPEGRPLRYCRRKFRQPLR